MLLSKSNAPGRVIAIRTRNTQFRSLLSAILVEWKYRVTEVPAEAAVTLVERGLSAEGAGGQIVWLSPMPLGDEPHLEVPIALTQLYHLLERCFFDRSRQHIRIALEQDVDLHVEGAWLVGHLTSLSDRGGRLSCPTGISRGQKLELVMKLDRKSLRIPAEVLYQIPAGDVPGRELPQIGVQFKPLEQQLCDALRKYIERITVEYGCRDAGLNRTDPSASWFDLVRDPWAGSN